MVLNDSAQVSPGAPVDITGIPAGASCAVWESDAKGAVSDHPETDPVNITIQPIFGQNDGEASVVTISNDFAQVQVPVSKVVNGGAGQYGQVDYDLSVMCTYNGQPVDSFPTTVKVPAGETRNVAAPAGAVCSVTEQDAHGATTTTISDPVTVRPDDTATLTVTNTFEAGALEILKEIRGQGADLPTGPFTFGVQCTFDGKRLDPIEVTITRSKQERDLVEKVAQVFPLGAECTFTETETGKADATRPLSP